MSRNLIYQYYYDWDDITSKKVDFKYYELSQRSMEVYCLLHDIEYRFLNKPLDVPFYGIFLPFQEGWCHEYDNICFVDSDMLATVGSKNIFDHVADNVISLTFMDTNRGLKYRGMMPKMRNNGHANSGVVNFPRAVYDAFTEYVLAELDDYNANKDKDIRIKDMGDFDQAFINLFIGRTGLYRELTEAFNWHLGRRDHNKRWLQNFIHYHRTHKKMMNDDFIDMRIIK